MDWKKKKFLVFGTGISGIAAAELLCREKTYVLLYDGNETVTKEQIREKSPLLEKIPLVTGKIRPEILDQIDIAVLSPGVPVDLPLVEQMKEKGILIWGEIELAYVAAKGKVLAITGTNGKTTTTTLLGEIMREEYEDVKVVGNIGVPYTGVAAKTGPDSVVVAEISSFQLETIHSFAPHVSAILNITPDHLNRHHTMENYIAVKKRIAENQSEDQVCVLNYEDEVLREFSKTQKSDTVFFSSERELKKGVYLKGEEIFFSDGRSIRTICNIGELKIFGKHNYENVMAAAAMALSFGISLEKIQEALVRFKGVAHRIEYVAIKNGVRFYNDSKGTNPDAAIKAIKAMRQPTLLIGGGYDKESEYQAWIEAFEGKVKKLVLLGATREKIAKAAIMGGFPKDDIILVDDMKEAVDVCFMHAESGDAVLLSPACASWDMFQSYEERGNLFKELVKELKE